MAGIEVSLTCRDKDKMANECKVNAITMEREVKKK